ncbi:MAG: RNA ligase family protein, partial [Bacteroidia bacterium]
GVTLCGSCHIKAEETTLSVEELRDKAGITKIILPEHLYRDQIYDKWGNPIMPDGKRLMGELFEDESVQKILKQGKVLDDFTYYIKYPRTYHMPNSTGTKDDKTLENDSQFHNEEVVVTLKMDGENTSGYYDHIHARSIDSGSHESRDWVKGLWAQKGWQLSPGMRVCGENLYARHSVHYENLSTYFMVFSIWDKLKCLSWDETLEYCQLLDLETVPVIYRGVYDLKKIEKAFDPYKKENEGYVIRLAGEFSYGNFRKSVAKNVLPEFRQLINNSHGHWISKKIIPNKLNEKI